VCVCGSVVKNPPASAGNVGSIPGSGLTLEKEVAIHSLQCSCLVNPMDKGAWWATVYGVAKELDTVTKQHQYVFIYMCCLKNSIASLLPHEIFSNLLFQTFHHKNNKED